MGYFGYSSLLFWATWLSRYSKAVYHALPSWRSFGPEVRLVGLAQSLLFCFRGCGPRVQIVAKRRGESK